MCSLSYIYTLCSSSLFRRPFWGRWRNIQFLWTDGGLHPGLAAFAASAGGALHVSLLFRCYHCLSPLLLRVALPATVSCLCYLFPGSSMTCGSVWRWLCFRPIPRLGSKEGLRFLLPGASPHRSGIYMRSECPARVGRAFCVHNGRRSWSCTHLSGVNSNKRGGRQLSVAPVILLSRLTEPLTVAV